MKICAVVAHPDDEMFCAGTLAKFVKKGHEVTTIIMGCGDKGNPDLSQEETIRERTGEAKEAARIIGTKLEVLYEKDGELYHDNKTRQKLIEVLKREKPDILITHYPDDYNPEHNITSQIALAASIFATLVYSSPSPPLTKLARVYYMETVGGFGFLPEVYVDITETFETKIKAIKAYQSQIRYMKKWPAISADLLELNTLTCRLRGVQCGVTYAEAYVMSKIMGRVKALDLLP